MQLPSSSDLPDEKFREIEKGEQAHLLLQAVGRICVRKCIGDKHPPATVYVLASKNGYHDAEELLRDTFPNCMVEIFRPTQIKAEKWEVLAEYLEANLANDNYVTFDQAMQITDLDDRANFNRLVRNNSEFRKAILKSGMYESSTGGKWANCFRRSDLMREGQTV